MITKPNQNPLEKLDPSRQADEVREFALALKRKIVGQEEAVQSLVEFFRVFKAGLSAPDRSSPTRLACPSRLRNR